MDSQGSSEPTRTPAIVPFTKTDGGTQELSGSQPLPPAGLSIVNEARDVNIQNGSFVVHHGNNVQVTNTHVHHHHNTVGEKKDAVRDAEFEERKQALLAKLPSNGFGLYHQSVGEKKAPGTGIALTTGEHLSQWLDSGGYPVLWFVGDAGAGKTYLAYTVVDRLEGIAEKTDNMVVIYAYLKFSDQPTTWEVVMGLIRQLVECTTSATVLKLVAATFDKHMHKSTKPSLTDLVKLLKAVLQEFSERVISIDGLDELTQDSQVELADILMSLDAKILIFSRPLPLLKTRLEKQGKKKVTCTGVIASDEDLDIFISHMIDKTPGFGDLLDELGIREEIIAKIKAKAGGMFLHVALHIEALRHCLNGQEVLEEIERLPTSIEGLYEQTMKRIEKQPERRLMLARLVLLWLLNCQRTITIDELRHAVAVAPGSYSFDSGRLVSQDFILAVCHGLVVVDESSRQVRLFHATAYEILPNLILEWGSQAHATIVRTCLARLADIGFQSCADRLPDLQTVGHLRLAFDNHPLLKYSYRNTRHHAHLALKSQPDIQLTVEQFVRACTSYPYDPYDSEEIDIAEAKAYRLQKLPALHVAVLLDLPDLIHSLVANEGIDVNTMSTRCGALGGASALMTAAWIGHEGVIDVLLSRGADPNLVDFHNGRTALMTAARRKGRESTIARLLASASVAVNTVDDMGWSALMCASIAGNHQVVQALLAHPEVDPNLRSTGTVMDNGYSTDEDDREPPTYSMMLSHTLGLEKAQEVLGRETPRSSEVLLSTPGTQHPLTPKLHGYSALMMAAYFGYQEVVDMLCSATGVDPNLVDELEGMSALMLASRKNRVSVIEAILNVSATQVNLVSKECQSALMVALSNNSIEAAAILLSVPGIDVNLADIEAQTALIIAVIKKHWNIVRALLRIPGININAVEMEGGSALSWASRTGHRKTVELLCSMPGHAVEVNRGDIYDGSTPLIHAIQGGHLDVVNILLQISTIDVNMTDDEGRSALCVAVARGHRSIVQALLGVPGIAVNLAGLTGKTALMLAAAYNWFAIVQLLLCVAEIHVNAIDHDGWSALMQAAWQGHVDVIRLLLTVPGIDVNNASKDGDTSLAIACKRGDDGVVELLLDHSGTNAQTINSKGDSPLSLAAGAGHTHIVRRLLDAPEVVINSTNTSERSALIVAADAGNKSVVELLLAAPSADANLADNGGKTALMVACSNGHKEVVEVLVAHPEVELNLVDGSGASALMLAARQGHDEIVELLRSTPGVELGLETKRRHAR